MQRTVIVTRGPHACRSYDAGEDRWLNACATVNSDGRLVVCEDETHDGVHRTIAHYNVGVWVMYHCQDTPIEDAKPGY